MLYCNFEHTMYHCHWFCMSLRGPSCYMKSMLIALLERGVWGGLGTGIVRGSTPKPVSSSSFTGSLFPPSPGCPLFSPPCTSSHISQLSYSALVKRHKQWYISILNPRCPCMFLGQYSTSLIKLHSTTVNSVIQDLRKLGSSQICDIAIMTDLKLNCSCTWEVQFF